LIRTPPSASPRRSGAGSTKFPDAIERAVGVRPALPERLRAMMAARERVAELPNDLGAVQAFITGRVRS
jgi:threonine synthase